MIPLVTVTNLLSGVSNVPVAPVGKSPRVATTLSSTA
jgi:hypothetical protein